MTAEKLSERIYKETYEKYKLIPAEFISIIDSIESLETECDTIKKQLEDVNTDAINAYQEVGLRTTERDNLKEQLRNALNDCTGHHKRAETLKEQNEKLLRKFKRIPATVADAYNETVALKEQLEKLQSAWIMSVANFGGAEAEVKRLTPFETLYKECKEERLQALAHVELLKKDSAMVCKLWSDDKAQYMARLAKAQGLIEEWRGTPSYDLTKDDCADELEEALGGDSPSTKGEAEK